VRFSSGSKGEIDEAFATEALECLDMIEHQRFLSDAADEMPSCGIHRHARLAGGQERSRLARSTRL